MAQEPTYLVITLLLVLLAGLAVHLYYSRKFDRWKQEHEDAIRKDSISKSRATTVGKISEQLAPFLPGFDFNPKDARFIGTPIDFIIFDGLEEGNLQKIVFVEVKSGDSDLTTRERKVRDAIRDRKVEWFQLRSDSVSTTGLPA